MKKRKKRMITKKEMKKFKKIMKKLKLDQNK